MDYLKRKIRENGKFQGWPCPCCMFGSKKHVETLTKRSARHSLKQEDQQLKYKLNEESN